MAEKPRGRDPNKGKEFVTGEPSLYHIGAKYPTPETSEDAYDTARDLIAAEPCDLSAYRFAVLPDQRWHVAVLGRPPAPELMRRVEEILLKDGEQYPLPDDVIVALQQRRAMQAARGEWVEHRSPRRRRTR